MPLGFPLFSVSRIQITSSNQYARRSSAKCFVFTRSYKILQIFSYHVLFFLTPVLIEPIDRISEVQAWIKGLVGPRHLVTFADPNNFLGSIQCYYLHVVFRRPLFPQF